MQLEEWHHRRYAPPDATKLERYPRRFDDDDFDVVNMLAFAERQNGRRLRENTIDSFRSHFADFSEKEGDYWIGMLTNKNNPNKTEPSYLNHWETVEFTKYLTRLTSVEEQKFLTEYLVEEEVSQAKLAIKKDAQARTSGKHSSPSTSRTGGHDIVSSRFVWRTKIDASQFQIRTTVSINGPFPPPLS